MCGYIGRIVPAGVTASRPLEAGVPWLARRGPDSQRLWSAPAEAPGQVDLLYVRLAIIDFTERAHQPMWHAERRIALVFNGEIYNYADVRSELPDFAFTTESDTEVILATYLAGGLGALRRLKRTFNPPAVLQLRRDNCPRQLQRAGVVHDRFKEGFAEVDVAVGRAAYEEANGAAPAQGRDAHTPLYTCIQCLHGDLRPDASPGMPLRADLPHRRGCGVGDAHVVSSPAR